MILKHKLAASLFIAASILISGLLLSCSSTNGLSTWSFWGGSTGEKLTNKEVNNFVSSIRPSPANGESYYQLGLYYQERSRHREAIAEFNKAIAVNPAHIKAYNALGVSYDKLGEYNNATRCYETALALNPNLDYVKNNLGFSNLQQGKIKEAIALLTEALTLNGNSKVIHNNLGRAYAMSGEPEKAIEEFASVGGEAYAHMTMGEYYYSKGKFENAAEQYAVAVKLDPGEQTAANRLNASLALARISPASLAADVAVKREESTTKSTALLSGHVSVVQSLSPEQAAAIVARDTMGSALENANIEISNGNGVTRMAKRLGIQFKEKGLKVARLTNADNFRHGTTKIFYRSGYEEAARELSQYLPAVGDAQKTDKFDRKNIKIKVLLGRDLAPYNKQLKERTK